MAHVDYAKEQYEMFKSRDNAEYNFICSFIDEPEVLKVALESSDKKVKDIAESVQEILNEQKDVFAPKSYRKVTDKQRKAIAHGLLEEFGFSAIMKQAYGQDFFGIDGEKGASPDSVVVNQIEGKTLVKVFFTDLSKGDFEPISLYNQDHCYIGALIGGTKKIPREMYEELCGMFTGEQEFNNQREVIRYNGTYDDFFNRYFNDLGEG